jgi:hypothetical protein
MLHCADFFPQRTVYRLSFKPLGKPFETAYTGGFVWNFEFERYKLVTARIAAVNRYRGAAVSPWRSVKKNLAFTSVL